METRGAKVLITGSNRGIGKAVAAALAENGANLYLANRRPDPNQIEELKKLGAQSVTNIRVDLLDRGQIEKLVRDLQSEEIDILFNNAGLLTGGLIEEQSIDEIYNSNQVNITALMHLTHGFVGGMVQRGRGKIINHASISAYMHMPCASVYAASKAAVVAFDNCIRPELKGTGVTVLTLVTPGVDTDLSRDIPNRYGKNLNLKLFKKGMPPEQYAKRVIEAIEKDRDVLEPKGMASLELKTAKYALGVFQRVVLANFRR